MHSTRFTQVFLAALGLVSVAQASGIRYNARGIMVRQDDGGDDDSVIPTLLPGVPGDGDDDGDDSDVPTSSPVDSSPSSPPAPTTSSVDPPSPTTTPEEEIPTSTPVNVPTSSEQTPAEPTTSEAGNGTPTTTSQDNNPAPTTSSAPQDEPSSTSANNNDDEETSTTRSRIVSTAIETVTRTNSDGTETTMTSSTLTTSTPGTQSGDDSGGGSGMSANTRNIVIGVVVGIGGAILLGALGVVAWRIRNRKKRAEENDGLMGDYSAGYSQMDKSEPPSSAAGTVPSSAGAGAGAGRSPFQSTLENYHQPTQPVNASSNF